MEAASPTDAQLVLAQTFACNGDVAVAIAAKARLRDYPARAVIVAADRIFEQVHVLVDGHARMLAFAIDGRLVAVEDYGKGDLFGETGLFEAEPAQHDIAAVVASKGAASNAVFLDLMANYHCVALAVSRRLVARLSTITRRMVEGATLSATGRIHAELLRQAQAGSAMTISPAPVLSAFALQVQSTRETVSRAINALEKRGIIQRDEQGLRIVAPHRLEELIY
jgi:CRP/FNR family cyclic AMP-dependent transcriptional regulator